LQKSLRVHFEVEKKKITLMWKPRPSVRLSQHQRLNRLSDFHEILHWSSSKKVDQESVREDRLSDSRVYIRAVRMF
jgi:hypothetical protein